MIKFSKNLVIIILTYFFIATTSSFGSISSEFINDVVNKASNILSSKKTKELKIKELIKIGEESADIDGIGFYMLGKHRKSLSDEQKIEYKKIFRTYFLKYFSGTMVEYNEAKIVVISEDVKNEKYTIVKSKLLATTNRPEISIDWRVYTKDPDKPLIRDLIIEGVSLARAQKEEFNSIIMNNDGSISALFATLKEFNNK
tara:strand:- start:19058 stop:19657 length:600 start_codon:yes stop_codon:yes gene_type:complete